MAETIQLGDIGTIFVITLKNGSDIAPINAASVKNIIFRKPRVGTTPGEVVTKTASFTTNGTDGKLQYVTVQGDLDIVGKWEIQAQVTLPGWEGHSAVGTFTVKSNL